jgi:ankyrin repeat protein
MKTPAAPLRQCIWCNGKTCTLRRVPQLYTMSRYENTIAKGNSRNVYGNVINTYNFGPQQAPESTPDATSPIMDDIKSLMKRLEFDQMDDRLATIVTAHSDTCQWLFESEEYIAWRHPDAVNTDRGFLWLKGKPGAGKSTLMKSARHYGEREHGDTVISFFFNARGVELQKSTQGMYRSLLYQLLDKRTEQLAALSKREGCSHHLNLLEPLLAKSPQRETRPTAAQNWPIEQMKDMLLELVLAFSPDRVAPCTSTFDAPADVDAKQRYQNSVLALAQTHVTCYVDAVDECNDDDARDIIDFLGTLRAAAAQADVGFRVLLTSRHYPHITFDACQEIILDSQAGHENDIAEYISSKLQIGESKLASEIRSIIQVRAFGIFLWVVLVVRILNELYDRGRKHQSRQRLDAIPSGLHNLFEEIVQKGTQEGDETLLAFQLILFSRRPLSLEEFYHAMTVTFEPGDEIGDYGQSAISADDMERFLLDTSKGLAELTWGDNPTVQFIHESVKNYLLVTGLVTISPGLSTNLVGQCHTQLQLHCRRYLESAKTALLPFLARADDLRSTHPLDYNNETTARRHVEKLKKTRFSFDSQRPSDSSTAAQLAHEIVEEVYAACPFLDYALSGIVYHADSAHSLDFPQHEFVETFPRHLWKEIYTLVDPFHPLSNDTSSLYIFILMGACKLSEFCIEAYGLSREWRTDVLPDKHRSLLGVAVHNGDNRMIDVLLSRGIGANWPAKDGDTCLTLALRERHGSILQQLIDAGATVDPDMNAPWGGSPRSAESLRSSSTGRVLRVLASSVYPTHWHPDFNGLLRFDRNDGDPTTSDEELRRVFIARLKALAVDNNVEPHQSYALIAACIIEEPEVAAALVKDGVDFEAAKDKWGNTTLSLATRMDYRRVVRRLLAHGAKPDIANSFGDHPIHEASGKGHDQIVRILLESGADPCAPDDYQRRPLHIAAIKGDENVARVLIDHGTALDALDSLGCTALDAAAAYGNLNVVEMLLEAGGGATSTEQLDRAADLASQSGHQHVVQWLLEKGARKPLSTPCDGK